MKYIPWIYRMRVQWVGGPSTGRNALDYEENIWILKLWGNPRWIACNSATLRDKFFKRRSRSLWYKNYNCVTAWYNPIDFKGILYNLKDFGI